VGISRPIQTPIIREIIKLHYGFVFHQPGSTEIIGITLRKKSNQEINNPIATPKIILVPPENG
jgi:hypothetical protein